MDYTRESDLQELWNMRNNAQSTAEKEGIEKTMYDIKENQNDEEINENRRELVGAVRIKDAKHVRKVSERIKQIAHKKGIERNG